MAIIRYMALFVLAGTVIQGSLFAEPVPQCGEHLGPGRDGPFDEPGRRGL